MNEATRIINQIKAGESGASEKLLPLVYDELRVLAARGIAAGQAIAVTEPGVGSSTIRFFDVNSELLVFDMANLMMRTQPGVDLMTIHSRTIYGNELTEIGGTMSGGGVTPIAFRNVRNFVLDTGTGDTESDGDWINVDRSAFRSDGLKFVTLRTGDGDDEISNTMDSYSLPEAEGAIRFEFGEGNDSMNSTSNANSVFLRADGLASSSGGFLHFDSLDSAMLSGGGGDNKLQVGSFAGPVQLHGLAGNDRLIAGAGPAIMHGNAGDDLLIGGAADDRMFGGPDNDIMLGEGGDDALIGFTGDDDLRGGVGNDILYGGENDDSLRGDEGEDYLDGEEGDDRLISGDGNDVLRGGAGADLFHIDGTENDDRITLNQSAAEDRFYVHRQADADGEILDRDDAYYDELDRIFMPTMEGDDVIQVGSTTTPISGILDGGLGTDLCSIPDNWFATNCE